MLLKKSIYSYKRGVRLKEDRLHNKVIVITGGSSGIGVQLAKDVAKLGARPVLIARSKDKLEEAKRVIFEQYGVEASVYSVDVSNIEAVEATFQEIIDTFGHVDVLVNNAGYAVFDTFIDASVEDVKGMFDVNVFGLVACTKAVLPSMLRENRGHIINIASQAGKLATPKSSIYSATKHAVLAITNSLRMELSETNIFITAVNPGPIKTPFFERADVTGNYTKNVAKFMLEPEFVSGKIIELMERPKRELNLPLWMGLGTKFYQLFPGLVERIAGKRLNQK